ncbi:MAG: hypothetical protein RIK87_15505 [Fuerstiella sp.]
MDVKFIIFLIVIVFSVIQSIVKAANEKAEKNRAQGADPGRRQRVQSEIEAFLADVSGTGNRPQADAAAQQNAERRQQRKKRLQEERRKQQQRKQAQQRPAAAKRPPRPAKTRSVGSGISQHVDQYMAQHVSEHIDRDASEFVEATVVDSVEAHLGNRQVEMPTMAPLTQKNQAAADVVALLKDPVGVRNAILVNEILSRPAVLRR